MKEYIITVHDPKIWDTGLWNELTKDGLGDNYIPKRELEVLNERPFNDFCAHFNLTEDEAIEIRKDPRIQSVELQADLQEDVKKEIFGTRPSRLYDKSGVTNQTMKNWGLLRCVNQTNPFSSGTAVTTTWPYNLDGTGVDIIVIDSGVEAGHPEFAVNADGTGATRVVDFNWASLGVPGTATSAQVNGYLGDTDGHGTHCAGISAGNTHGWASGATIYSIRIFDGYNVRTGQYQGAINSDICFDIVKAFHLAKISAGNTRPTICTNSWGYRSTYSGMQYTIWRGTQYNNTSPSSTYGQVNFYHPYVVNYLDASATSCANAGVILVGAAGNYYHKADVSTGIDYNNYYRWGTGLYTEDVYYHRGMSPTRADGMICVGSVDNSTVERKSNFSETGPRIDLYAPGSAIMSAYAGGVSDPRKPGYFVGRLSGTSMACPQVTGVLACLLQARPNLTTAQAKDWLAKSSLKNVLDQNVAGGTGYANNYNLQGGENRILFQPFTNPKPLELSGALNINTNLSV